MLAPTSLLYLFTVVYNYLFSRFMIIKRIDILDKWDDEECVSFKEVSQAATVREDGVLVRVVDERVSLSTRVRSVSWAMSMHA